VFLPLLQKNERKRNLADLGRIFGKTMIANLDLSNFEEPTVQTEYFRLCKTKADKEEFMRWAYLNNNRRLRTQRFTIKPLPWVNYGSEEFHELVRRGYYPNHREKISCELVLDIDGNKYQLDFKRRTEREARETYKQLKIKLQDFSWASFHSGGKGIHIHLLFPELKNFTRLDRQEMKRLLKRHLAWGFLTKEKGKGFVDPANPQLTQLEFARHRKGGFKSLIEINDVGINQIPPEVRKKFSEWKNRFKRMKPKEFHSDDDPPCIKFLNFEDFTGIADGRKRAAFMMASYYLNKFKGDRELTLDRLREWNNYNLGGYLPDSFILGQVRCVRGLVGCRTMQSTLLEPIGKQEMLCKRCRRCLTTGQDFGKG